MKVVIFLVNSLFIIGSLADGVPGKCPKIDTAKDIQTDNVSIKFKFESFIKINKPHYH